MQQLQSETELYLATTRVLASSTRSSRQLHGEFLRESQNKWQIIFIKV